MRWGRQVKSSRVSIFECSLFRVVVAISPDLGGKNYCVGEVASLPVHQEFDNCLVHGSGNHELYL